VTFLDALPDDMRQEVINQHLREQGAALRRETMDHSQFFPEFLAALPDEMRQEVLAQDQFEVHQPELNRRNPFEQNIRPAKTPEKTKMTQSKESVNVFDWAGLSSLVRLLYIPERVSKESLEQIFVNVCENSKSRTELLSMFLSILTNDSHNLVAVDTNFSFLTLQNAGEENAAITTELGTFSLQNLVIQRTLEILYVLCKQVPSVGKYFLTESDLYLKTPKSVKKGKGKDKNKSGPPSPVVTLLDILNDLDNIQSPQILEQLIELLTIILRPLAHIAKKKFSTRSNDPEKQTLQKTPVKANLDSSTKEKHDIKLPTMPETSVKSIVNVLTKSVCTNKTFQFTLCAIQYLCSYPENLNIIICELLDSAQRLASSLTEEVDVLYQQLRSETMVSTDSLSQFSNSSSSQARLLRILKSIDFLFTSKHGKVPLIQGFHLQQIMLSFCL
jgi:E3 ubiquitin-protein ligase HUWE1